MKDGDNGLHLLLVEFFQPAHEQRRRSTITEYPSSFALPHSPRFTKNIKVQNVLRFSINSRQSVFNTVYSVRCLSCLRVKGSFQEAALIIFPSTPIKKHGRWNEKMAETGQEEGKQNIRIEGALLICFGPQMDVHYSYVFCAIVYKIGHPLYVKKSVHILHPLDVHCSVCCTSMDIHRA
ncbi:hypothetical protein NQ317_018024 [Molorchus minor]|uniref:Uncharacterized protein n=1 Tax=Molorchus minor TaxID=1323400 RepID=A0ABQ9JUJ3_9CUCU|nr:hypothetical protein NQ317_018024 [Molorchus minor]